MLVEALDALPKVELHCHVEGTMRPQTVVELARANGVPLPTSDPQELYVYDSLDGFLRVFWLVQSTLATRGDWTRLGYESVVDGAAHRLVYRESFVTPARHLAGGQRLADVVAGLDEGLAAAEDETGVVCRLIVDMDRAFGPKAGAELVEQLTDLRRAEAPGMDRVIGVGMDSTELGIDPASYLPAYQTARAAGFRLTAHQGENSPPAAIATCLDVLGVQRIDHGLPLLDDPDLTARMATEPVPLTVCPTSTSAASTQPSPRPSTGDGAPWCTLPSTASRGAGSTIPTRPGCASRSPPPPASLTRHPPARRSSPGPGQRKRQTHGPQHVRAMLRKASADETHVLHSAA